MVIKQVSSEMQESTFSVGVLNSKALPEGLNAVYLQGKLYKISNKSGEEPLIACAISLLHNLNNEGEGEFADLQQAKRIGLLDVREGRIHSLIIPHEAIHGMQQQTVNEIAMQVNNKVLMIKDKMILREFASEEEYQRYTNYWR